MNNTLIIDAVKQRPLILYIFTLREAYIIEC